MECQEHVTFLLVEIDWNARNIVASYNNGLNVFRARLMVVVVLISQIISLTFGENLYFIQIEKLRCWRS